MWILTTNLSLLTEEQNVIPETVPSDSRGCSDCSNRCKSGDPNNCTHNHRFSNLTGSDYYECLECGIDWLTREDILSTGITSGADLATEVANIARITGYKPHEWKDTHRRKFRINERRDLLVTVVKATGTDLGIKALQRTLLAYYPRPVPGERLNHLIADGIGFEYPPDSVGTRSGDARLRNDALRSIRSELLDRGFTTDSHPVALGATPSPPQIDTPEWQTITEEYDDLTTCDLATAISESTERCEYRLELYNGARKRFSGDHLKQILLTLCEDIQLSQVARLVDVAYNEYEDSRVPKHRLCREIGHICGFAPCNPFSSHNSRTRRFRKAELSALYHILENGLSTSPSPITDVGGGIDE